MLRFLGIQQQPKRAGSRKEEVLRLHRRELHGISRRYGDRRWSWSDRDEAVQCSVSKTSLSTAEVGSTVVGGIII